MHIWILTETSKNTKERKVGKGGEEKGRREEKEEKGREDGRQEGRNEQKKEGNLGFDFQKKKRRKGKTKNSKAGGINRQQMANGGAKLNHISNYIKC